MSLSEFLARLRDRLKNDFEIRYYHPELYIIYSDIRFKGLNSSQRLLRLSDLVEVPLAEIETIIAGGNVNIQLTTAEERANSLDFLGDNNSAGHHWIEFLANPQKYSVSDNKEGPRAVHFYGYKGGQARSTVLAMFAQHMAADGYRVLIVDADFEAPSLDILFETALEGIGSTLMGAAKSDTAIQPQPVFLSGSLRGKIDLLGCRPKSAIYDLDFSIFTLKCNLDALFVEQMFGRIRSHAVSAGYDIILIDHRSGISGAILPIMSICQGPTVIFARLDDQSNSAQAFFGVLLRQNPEVPGLFVSFTLDPEDSKEKLLTRCSGKVESLLGLLEQSLLHAASPGGEEEVPPREDLGAYWTPWFHERAFLRKAVPALEEISKENRDALTKMRELIQLSSAKVVPAAIPENVAAQLGMVDLTGSGNTDKGLLIETEALKKLLTPNNQFSYIFGRKGTGKTRLLRELSERQLGEPLLVAADFQGNAGIKSTEPLFTDLVELCSANPERLWWVLLLAALEVRGTNDRAGFEQAIRKQMTGLRKDSVFSIEHITNVVAKHGSLRVFLIDGVETAVRGAQLAPLIEGLFRFLNTIQTNAVFREFIRIRLFLRSDLAARATENVEQQTENKKLSLAWDAQAILNFVLSRISQREWFQNNFPEAIKEIRKHQVEIQNGTLSEQLCSSILSLIFPEQLRRNNLNTLTFLKIYFSDTAGTTGIATYYPRVYDSFLQAIAEPEKIGRHAVTLPQLEEGKVGQKLIFAAHEVASKDYLDQVTDELSYLISLHDDFQTNRGAVRDLLGKFSGLPTPFKLQECLDQLIEKGIAGATRESLERGLNQMKELGIFEARVDIPNEWRVGRLFKASLGMRYFRK